MAGFLGQRIGDIAAFNVRHQYVGGGEGIMFAVGIHDNTVADGHIIVGQQSVQVRQGRFFLRAGEDQQLAAALHIVAQHCQLFVRDVAGGRIDKEGVAILGNLVYIQQREILNGLIVAAGQLVAEVIGQRDFAVAAEQVDLRQFIRDHVVDGRGDLSLTVEALADRAGGVVAGRVHLIDVVVADVTALVAALDHQRVVHDRFIGVLLGEGRVDVRVFLDHRNEVGQILIAVQQLIQHGAFLPGLSDPVDGHVLVQVGRDHFGIRCQ